MHVGVGGIGVAGGFEKHAGNPLVIRKVVRAVPLIVFVTVTVTIVVPFVRIRIAVVVSLATQSSSFSPPFSVFSRRVVVVVGTGRGRQQRRGRLGSCGDQTRGGGSTRAGSSTDNSTVQIRGGRAAFVQDIQHRLDGTIVSALDDRGQVVSGILPKVELQKPRESVLSFRPVLGHDPFPELVHDFSGQDLSVVVGKGAQSLDHLRSELGGGFLGEFLDQRLLDLPGQLGLWRCVGVVVVNVARHQEGASHLGQGQQMGQHDAAYFDAPIPASLQPFAKTRIVLVGNGKTAVVAVRVVLSDSGKSLVASGTNAAIDGTSSCTGPGKELPQGLNDQ